MPLHGSEGLADRLRPFAPCFTAAVRRHVLVLVAGTLLAPGRRTVTAALRVMGLERSAGFTVHHRVLSAARWSARAVAHRLLLVLAPPSSPTGCSSASTGASRRAVRGSRPPRHGSRAELLPLLAPLHHYPVPLGRVPPRR